MKRRDLLEHLAIWNCELHDEGSNHSVWWNTHTGVKSAVPRHQEISNMRAAEICKQLGIPRPGR